MTTLYLLALLAGGIAIAETPAAPKLRVTMISLGVKDAPRSAKFYADKLGLEILGRPGEVTLVKAGDITLVLNEPLARGAGNDLVGAVEIIFPVESVAAAHQDFAARGCAFVAKPHEVTPGIWAATFTDPDGHRLTLLGHQ